MATLLDLAPWELPEVYAASPAARFGHRLRARVLHDAVRLIVCSRATAESARRLLRIPAERIAVVPLAPDDAFQPAAASADRVQALRARLALPERYLVFAGRYDARKDLGTLFRALGALRDEGPVRGTEAWPPVLVLAGALGSDESDSVGLARAAARHGVGDLVHQVPRLGPAELATLEGGARAVVFPAVSEGTGLVVQEALAVGTPVVASRVGPLPELVGKAGIVVEARDPDRLAAALRVMWADERVRGPDRPRRPDAGPRAAAQLGGCGRGDAGGLRRGRGRGAERRSRHRLVTAQSRPGPGGGGGGRLPIL